MHGMGIVGGKAVAGRVNRFACAVFFRALCVINKTPSYESKRTFRRTQIYCSRKKENPSEES
jgi:hypothetical protein